MTEIKKKRETTKEYTAKRNFADKNGKQIKKGESVKLSKSDYELFKGKGAV